MRWERGDLAVGTLVLAVVLLLVGSFVWLSPMLSREDYTLFAEFDRIDGIADRVPVTIQGYAVGRVEKIEPHVRRDGAVFFRVRMSIRERLGSGEVLRIPAGTRAVLAPPAVPIGLGTISLVPARGGAPLASGATIPGERTDDAVAEVRRVIEALGGDLALSLASARAAMDSMAVASAVAGRSIAQAAATLPGLVRRMETDLAAVDSLTREVRLHVGALGPAAVAQIDSAGALIAESRALVASMSEAATARGEELGRVVARLDTTTTLFSHYVRQGTRRPLRFLTGVRPPEGVAACDSAAAREGGGC